MAPRTPRNPRTSRRPSKIRGRRPADRRARRPRAQPQQHQRRAAARPADRVHRPVRVGQVVARLRHDLRRGPAPLRRVAVVLRPPVPRADGQARRRRHRGPVAGDLDRPEVGRPQPPLDRRHDHRGLRLPAPAVRPHRRAALPDDGTRLQRQTPQQIVDRILLLPEGTRFQVLAPVVRGRKGEYDTLLEDLSGQGFVRARIDGEVVDIDEFLKRDERLARYEQHTIEVVVDRLVLREGIDRRLTDSLETALRLADGVAEVEIVAPARASRRERDADVLPAPRRARRAGAATTSRRRATSRSTRRTAPARRATGSARRSRSTPSWSSPTPTCRSTTAPSPRGARPTRSTSRACSRRSPTANGIDLDAPWAQAHGQAAEGHPRGHRRQRHGQVQEPLRPAAPVHAPTYEGVIPWIKRRHEGAESDWSREQYEGYMREVPCTRVRRRPAQAGVARRHDQRPQHRRGLRAVDRRERQVPRRARADRARPDDRRAGDQGDQRPARLPARRRPRLPHAVAARPARSPAARRSASASPARSAPASSARCTCSTSRRSACTSATTAG